MLPKIFSKTFKLMNTRKLLFVVLGCSQCHRSICCLISQIPTAKQIYVCMCMHLCGYTLHALIFIYSILCVETRNKMRLYPTAKHTKHNVESPKPPKNPCLGRRLNLTKWTTNHKFHRECLFPIYLDFIVPLFLPVLWKQLFFTKA